MIVVAKGAEMAQQTAFAPSCDREQLRIQQKYNLGL
jgi:hypothetical protein